MTTRTSTSTMQPQKTLVKKNMRYEHGHNHEYHFNEPFTLHEGRRLGMMGGYSTGGSAVTTLQAVNITTLSSCVDYGEMSQARHDYEAWGNQVRIVTTDDGTSETAEYSNWVNFGNAADWGEHQGDGGAFRNTTGDNVRSFLYRHSSGGGDSTIVVCNIMAGSGADFGESPLGAYYAGGGSGNNGYRGVFMGAASPTASLNTIEYITFANSGAGIDFGDLPEVSGLGAHGADLTDGSRAISISNYRSDTDGATYMHYVNVGTTSNASEYGNMFQAIGLIGGGSYSGRGMHIGGYAAGSYHGEMGYFNIGVNGHSIDFGEMSQVLYTPGCKSGG